MTNSPLPAGSTSESAAGREKGRRHLSRRRRLLLLVIVLVVLATVQEIIFRLAFPSPEFPSFNRIQYTPLEFRDERFEAARKKGLGNIRYLWESEADGFAFEHTLNLYGFRGPEVAALPPRHRDRVLFVGDSFVEGCGAADQDTIPEQFARAVADTRPVEVINLGINGIGFPNYVRLVRDGLSVFPQTRAVFLVTCVNDLPAPPYEDEYDAPPPKFEPLNRCVPRALQAVLRLSRGESLPRWYHTGPTPFFDPVPSASNPLTSNPPPPGIDPQVLDAMRRGKVNPFLAGVDGVGIADVLRIFLSSDLTVEVGATRYLERIAAICREHEARLIVVYIPYHAVTNPRYLAAHNRLGGQRVGRLDGPEYRQHQRHLHQVTNALGIPFLDMTPAFIQVEKSGGRMFWPIDSHCTAAGYELVAQVCAAYWTREEIPTPSVE